MTLSPEHQEALLAVAGAAIDHGLATGRAPPIDPARFDPPLRERRASFVTLHLDGRLRGCVGALEAHQALVADVSEHAFAAAFRDPRFAPLTPSERAGLELHISVLTPNSPIRFDSEPDLLSQLRPGVDGLIIADERHRATFLPSVWESLPDPAQFLAHLKHKAGLAPGATRYSAWRYTTESIPAA